MPPPCDTRPRLPLRRVAPRPDLPHTANPDSAPPQPNLARPPCGGYQTAACASSRGSPARGVQHPEIESRRGITLLGRLAKPLQGLSGILRYADTLGVHFGQPGLTGGIACSAALRYQVTAWVSSRSTTLPSA